MRIVLAFLIGLVSSSRSAPQVPDTQSLNDKARRTEMKLSDPLDRFTKDMFSILTSQNRGNVVFSPFSIHNAMSMMYYGSPEDSETHRQLARALSLNNPEFSKEYLLNYLKILNDYEKARSEDVRIANKVFIDQSIDLKENFRKLLRLFYKSDVGDFDVQSESYATIVDRMNRFVERSTNGIIRNLFSPSDIDEFTKLVLVNAIYFKGSWQKKFDRRFTGPGTFNVDSSQNFVYDKMMRTNGSFWALLGDNEYGADILELPYGGSSSDEDFSMLILLPKEGSDILELGRRIRRGGQQISDIVRKMSLRNVRVTMPQFKIGFKTQLLEAFQALGVRDVFDRNLANLSDIVANPDEKLSVDKIVHQAEIEVNEEGSEAVAATGVVVGTRSSGANRKPVDFTVDRPFIFVILDKRNNIPLFFGRIVDPSNRGRTLQTGPNRGRTIQADPNRGRTVQTGPNRGRTVQTGPNRGRSVQSDTTTIQGQGGPLQAITGILRKLVDCSQLGGFQEIEDPESITFPCKGFDTKVLRQMQAQQRRLRQSRMFQLANIYRR